MMTCRKCGESKRPQEFARQPGAHHRSRICRKCSRLAQLLARGTKLCTCCDREKPLDDFVASQRGLGGTMNRCKACHSEIEATRRRETAASVSVPRQGPRDNPAFAEYAAGRDFTDTELEAIREMSTRIGLTDPSPHDLSVAYADATGIDQARECSMLSAASLMAQ